MTTDTPMTDDALPEPAGYFYEFNHYLGLHRSFRQAHRNGVRPDRAVAYYTADQLRAAIAAEYRRGHIAGKWIAEKRAEFELSTLREQLAEAALDAATLRNLLSLVPLPPKAITYEGGWKLLDALQKCAIDAAIAAKGEGA